MSIVEYDPKQLDRELKRVYKGQLATAYVSLEFTSPFAGGQPASEEGARAFVKHHRHLEGTEAENEVNRILGQEVRIDKPLTEDETAALDLEHTKTYSLNVIRRTSAGVGYAGTWMIRAMLKQSASRLGIFVSKKQSKGDMSESMLVEPDGPSAISPDPRFLQHVCLVDEDGRPFKTRHYEKFYGSVGTPKGRMSIVHDTELCPVGWRLHFKVQWPITRVTVKDMLAIFKLGERIGLGSIKAMEFGRFRIIKVTVDEPDRKSKDEDTETDTSDTKTPATVTQAGRKLAGATA